MSFIYWLKVLKRIKLIFLSLLSLILFPIHLLSKKDKINLQYVRNILIFYLSGIGNAVMLTPFLTNLIRIFKNRKIKCMFLKNGSIDLIKHLGLSIEEISKSDFSNPFKFILLALKLRKEKFDIAFLPYPNQKMRGAILMKLADIPVTIGHMYKTGFIKNNPCFLTFPVKLENKHDAEKNLDLLRILGLKIEEKKLFLKIIKNNRIDGFLKKFNQRNKKIALHLGDKEYKDWGEENFVKLITLIKKNFNCDIFLLGSGKDRYVDGTIDLRNKMNLEEVTYFISRMDLIIGNDTGLMHIAEAVDTPFIAIFGPTDPMRIGPYTKSNKFVAVYKNLPCRPCYKIDEPIVCKYKKCLKEIKVEEVYKIVSSILTNSE